MADINNLNALTDKIYQEGLEKVQKESKEILSKAELDRNHILEAANAEAQKIITKAEKEAARITSSTEKELQLKGKQLLSDLKKEIQNMLSQKILETNTKKAFVDVPFLKEIILESIKSWNPEEDLELTLAKEMEEKFEVASLKSIHDHVNNLSLTFDERLKGGFVITKKSDAYKISFTDEDFEMLFKPYLSNQVSALLFK